MPRPSAYYLLAVVVIAFGGAPKGNSTSRPSVTAFLRLKHIQGYDEGGFSASINLKSFERDFNLLESQWKDRQAQLANRTGNITSFGVLGAAIGALIALFFNDRIGRLRSYQAAECIWASGIIMQVFASGIYSLELFARIWAGLGAGALTVVCPLMMSEIAPMKTRGMTVSIFMVVLLTMLTLGAF